MKSNSRYSLVLIAAMAWSPVMHAAESTDTITVVAEDAEPADVASTITLPTKASPKAVEQSKKGLDTANAARATQGNATAAEARELGREFGEGKAEAARSGNPAAEAREAAREARNDNAANRPTPPGKP